MHCIGQTKTLEKRKKKSCLTARPSLDYKSRASQTKKQRCIAFHRPMQDRHEDFNNCISQSNKSNRHTIFTKTDKNCFSKFEEICDASLCRKVRHASIRQRLTAITALSANTIRM